MKGRLYWTKISTWIGVLAAAISFLLASSLMFNKIPSVLVSRPVKYTVEDEQFKKEMQFIFSTLKKHEEFIDDFRNQVDALKNPDTNTEVGAQTALIRSDIAVLTSRVKTLEDGLLDNPEKALAIPLIRKDIQKLEVSYQENIAAMTQNIDRIYDQNKWFIGLIFTMAIGLISLSISNFVQMRKKE